MKNQLIALSPEPKLMQLKVRSGGKWYFIFWGAMFFLQLLILAFIVYDLEEGWQHSDPLFFSLQPIVPMAFIARGIYSLRKNQQLFVAFEPNKIRFRDKPGDEITVIPFEQLQSIEQHALGAYFHLINRKKIHLNWEQADYANIQQIKEQLRKLKPMVKV